MSLMVQIAVTACTQQPLVEAFTKSVRVLFFVVRIMYITRDQAICMLFYVEYTEENVYKYKKRLEEVEGFEVCYNVDQTQPILAPTARIYGDPISYHRYPQ
ncbi:uncharacterized protein BYT42DRAFT_589267 [Radiomyces spectabilis]|uniref:uncharacterized protein n=1 Tax=Radiomyces spectabilis TaxID=64574 RepID=UPI00221FB016|nr:uncharacterized protein BYT42DRAFT_589267 [Radiomyces spectabilis]KAI8365232.1 hypothetical protein BYT42DRAFT_589267 [Radiomyces spectabilis]